MTEDQKSIILQEYSACKEAVATALTTLREAKFAIPKLEADVAQARANASAARAVAKQNGVRLPRKKDDIDSDE